MKTINCIKSNQLPLNYIPQNQESLLSLSEITHSIQHNPIAEEDIIKSDHTMNPEDFSLDLDSISGQGPRNSPPSKKMKIQ